MIEFETEKIYFLSIQCALIEYNCKYLSDKTYFSITEFTDVTNHAGRWENMKKACKSRAKDEGFTMFCCFHNIQTGLLYP